MARKAKIIRKTTETDIALDIDLDKSAGSKINYNISAGIDTSKIVVLFEIGYHFIVYNPACNSVRYNFFHTIAG